MKLKLSRLTALMLLILLPMARVNSQSDNTFTPYGKPLVLVFSDVNTSFNKNGNSKAFELTRAYLGYEYYFSKSISSRVNIDIGDPGTGKLQMTAFIKNAYLQYKNGGFSARFGMIGTDQYNIQEKQWGYRYIYKSFQDAYNFGPSADLGAALEYTPTDYITIDASVLNGEGFKKLQSDSVFKTSVGLTLRPLKGLVLRGFIDRMKSNYAQTSIALFAGFSIKTFKAGFEYNIQNNNGMLNGHDFSGVSFYSSVMVAQKVSIFSRYDYLWSETIADGTNPWNNNKDGQLIMAGFDYSPVVGVKIAPNYQGWVAKNKSEGFTSRVGLNVEVKF